MNTRAFAFSIDMVFGALIVIMLLSFFAHVFQPTNVSQFVLLQIQAKDATMVWFYSYPEATCAPPGCNPIPTSGKPFACDIGFRPDVNTSYLDPALPSSWVVQTSCVEGN